MDGKGITFVPKGSDNNAILHYREVGGGTVVFKGDNTARHFSPYLGKSGYMLINSIEAPS